MEAGENVDEIIADWSIKTSFSKYEEVTELKKREGDVQWTAKLESPELSLRKSIKWNRIVQKCRWNVKIGRVLLFKLSSRVSKNKYEYGLRRNYLKELRAKRLGVQWLKTPGILNYWECSCYSGTWVVGHCNEREMRVPAVGWMEGSLLKGMKPC